MSGGGKDGGKVLMAVGTLVGAGLLLAGTYVATTIVSSINDSAEKGKLDNELEKRRMLESTALRRNEKSSTVYWLDLSFPGFEGDDVDATVYRKMLARDPKDEKNYDSILRDVTRTMPAHSMFKCEEGKKKLTNILLAYSRWDPDTGYVQGMNFIAANILLHYREEDAFKLFVRLMQHRKYNVKDCYGPTLHKFKMISHTMDGLVAKYVPRVHKHFDTIGVMSSQFVQEWVTLYTYTSTMPRPMLNSIWDLFFISGWSIIYRVWICILQLNEEHILRMNFEECVGYFHSLHKDDDRLSVGETRLLLPLDLLDTAINVRINDTEIENLESEFDRKVRMEGSLENRKTK